MIENKKIFKWEDVENISISEIKKLYSDFVNTKQSLLFSKLSYGNAIFAKAEGMYLYTNDNKKILDFTGGIGVLNLGHNHPRLLKTRIEFQKKKMVEVNKLYFSPYTAILANNLANILPQNLEKSFFTNSGAEAVEGAIKIAYKYHNSKRDVILHSNISFHGNLIASGSISASSKYKKNFPILANTDSFIYGDINSVKDKINYYTSNNNCNIYALIIEPFHAASLKSCDERFLKELKNICKQNKIILIFDEVYVGWGKTGHLFYFMKYDNINPDILTTSKSFGGGKSSISAYISSDEIFQKAYGTENNAFLHSSTYNGFGEECATAIETINIILEEKLIDRASILGEFLKKELTNLSKKHSKQISNTLGEGLLQGIILKTNFKYIEKVISHIPLKFIKDKKSLFSKLPYIALIDHLYLEYKILTHITPNYEIFLVSPSLIVKKEEIQFFIKCLNKAYNENQVV